VVLGPGAAGREEEVARAGADRVEDGFSVLDLAAHGFRAEFFNEVMLRPPGPLGGGGTGVRRVRDAAGLARAEAMLVEAFWSGRAPGELLPRSAISLPGWDTWISEDGAGSVTTYDDGATVGVYWLGVRPEARSRGLGRALMSAALAAAPARPAVLSSTAQGRPLYESLGFEALGTATWWRREAPQ
jgi:GNAT superfamily N-acetyltransferase